jgi:hypothetical protein
LLGKKSKKYSLGNQVWDKKNLENAWKQVKDRVVQQALKNVLEPIFEEIFLPQSHGYRPGTDAHAAVRKAEAYINEVDSGHV